MTGKSNMAVMVGYTDNNKRDTYKLHNPETKRGAMTRDVNRIPDE